MSRWCQQYQSETTETQGLASVAIQTAVISRHQAAIQLQLRSGTVLELPLDISPRWLGALLQCLV